MILLNLFLFIQDTDVDTDNEEIRQRDEAIAKAESDTDNEEIRQRDEAIAEAESDAAQLQRELRETEQSELTDTGDFVFVSLLDFKMNSVKSLTDVTLFFISKAFLQLLMSVRISVCMSVLGGIAIFLAAN